jgi:predicted Zn-dependent protease
MKRFCLAVCFFLLCPALWAKSPPPLPSLDQAGMLALVQRHIALSEPKVDTKNRAVLREIRATLDRARPTPSRYKTTIDELISRLTFETAQMKAPATLLVASGTLVKEQIHPRTLNLFGNALLMTGKAADAAQTFSFALTLKPKDELLRLNLASALLDADYDKGAKKLLLQNRQRPDDV